MLSFAFSRGTLDYKALLAALESLRQVTMASTTTSTRWLVFSFFSLVGYVSLFQPYSAFLVVSLCFFVSFLFSTLFSILFRFSFDPFFAFFRFFPPGFF